MCIQHSAALEIWKKTPLVGAAKPSKPCGSARYNTEVHAAPSTSLHASDEDCAFWCALDERGLGIARGGISFESRVVFSRSACAKGRSGLGRPIASRSLGGRQSSRPGVYGIVAVAHRRRRSSAIAHLGIPAEHAGQNRAHTG